MRKGRYSSSGSTPLDQDVDRALKREVERISREKNAGKKEPQLPERSPELQAYYTGQRVRRKPVEEPEITFSDIDDVESEELVQRSENGRNRGRVNAKGKNAGRKRSVQPKKKENQVLDIIGYTLYHFVAMGLIAVCVILIYFCFKFYFLSNGKQQRTEYHYHEAGETVEDTGLAELPDGSAV